MVQYNGPLPQPTPETKPFFDGLKQRRLMIQRCCDCGQAFFHPRSVCPLCDSSSAEWFQASGKGSVYSFVIKHASPPGLETPSVIAVVQLEEGPQLMANLVGVESGNVRCGLAVEMHGDIQDGERNMPVFCASGQVL